MTTQYTPNFALALPDFRMGPWHDLVNTNTSKIDAMIFSALSQANVVPWANATHYIPGVTATDTDASVWMCAVDHTSASTGTFAADRVAHPTYWTRLLTGFAPRGQWTNSTNYFPYDLVYDSARGIMALCQTQHTSNPSGNIKDDSAFWAFLIDMSSSTLATAVAVTYSNSSSAIPSTNVQGAIDYTQSEIVSLNSVNVSQGSQISALQTSDGTQNTTLTSYGTRITTVENTNTTQDSTLSNHNTRITSIESLIAAGAFFAAGTVMVFYQAAAPTGWTKLTTQSDKVLRVVAGPGGGAGGTNSFSAVNAITSTGSHKLTVAEMPAHTHTIAQSFGGSGQTGSGMSGVFAGTTTTSSVGGDGLHSHPLTLDMQYIDVIIASKN
jgi:hypothetical protein